MIDDFRKLNDFFIAVERQKTIIVKIRFILGIFFFIIVYIVVGKLSPPPLLL